MLNKTSIYTLLAAIILSFLPTDKGWAEENTPEWSPKLSGFASLGASRSDSSANYLLSNFNNELSFRKDTILGLQFDSKFSEQFKFSTQLTTEAKNDFKVKTEWLFLSYQLSKDILARAGRLRLPTYLYSQSHYVGYSYPWARPPEEVYQQSITTNYDGLELIYQITYQDKILTLQPYLGDVKEKTYSIGVESDFEATDLYGIVTQLETEFLTFRLSGLETTAALARPATNTDPAISQKMEASFITAGILYDNYHLLFVTEVAKRNTDSAIFGDTIGWYTTIGYHFNQLTPYFTYAKRSTNGSWAAYDQKSISGTLGVRVDFNHRTALKLEYQRGLPQSDTRGMYTELANENTSHVNLLSAVVSIIF